MTTTTTTATTTTTTPKATAPKAPAGKLAYDRMKRDVLNKSLKAAGIERVPLENGVPAKVALAKDAQALQAFYLAKLESPEGQSLELMVCDPADGGCGGESPGDLVGCPFCGTGDADAAEAASKDAGQEKKAPAPKDRPSTKGKLALVPSHVPPGGGGPVQKLAEKFAGFPATSKLEDVDASVRRIEELKAQGAKSLWQIGDELRNVYERETWRQRHVEGDPSKLAYRSFNAWVEKECHFTTRYALELINVAAAFTEDEVIEVGVTKLEVIARVPDEWKGLLLERVKKGMKRAELVEQAKALTGASSTPRDTGRKGFRAGKEKVAPPTAAAAKAKAKAKAAKLGKERRPDGSIAIVMLKQRDVIPLFKRVGKGQEERRALCIADEPHGKLELADGRHLYVRIAQDAKGLKVAVEIAE